MLVRRRIDLVYGLPSGWHTPPNLALPSGVNWTFDDRCIRELLAGDIPDVKGLLRKGFLGLVLHKGDTWVAYAWMSRPGTLGPSHLPIQIRRLSVYWIFNCHTRKEFRGRGFYKSALWLLSEYAVAESGDANVFIDTTPDNVASRRGITGVGFEPRGIVTTWAIGIPRVRWWYLGYWDPNALHPRL